jgi:hypothetical protein
VNTAPPALSGTFLIDQTLAVTPGTWTGSPSLTYTLLRDGAPISGLAGVSEATIEAYTLVAADIGPSLVLREVDSVSSTHADSSSIIYAHATHLPNTAIGVSTAGLTLADANTTVNQWAATLGGVSCTLAAGASTNRPAYNATGGVGSRPLVTFDGADDRLNGTFTKGSALTSRRAGVVGQRVAFGTGGDVWIGYSVSNSMVFGIRDHNAAAFQGVEASVATSASTTDPDGANGHYWLANDGSSQTLGVGGTTEDTDTATPTTRADGNLVVLGGGMLGAHANIAIQAWHFGPNLNSEQVTHLRALLSYHTGVSC